MLSCFVIRTCPLFCRSAQPAPWPAADSSAVGWLVRSGGLRGLFEFRFFFLHLLGGLPGGQNADQRLKEAGLRAGVACPLAAENDKALRHQRLDALGQLGRHQAGEEGFHKGEEKGLFAAAFSRRNF